MYNVAFEEKNSNKTLLVDFFGYLFTFKTETIYKKSG